MTFKRHTYRVSILSWTVSLLLISPVLSIHAATTNWSTQPNQWEAQEAAKKIIKRQASQKVDSSPYSPDSHNLALDLGQVFLMGDLSRYSNSIGAQLHYTYGVSELFAFDSSLGFSEHSEGRYSMTSLLTGLRANLSWFDKIVPYAVFGLGFYRPSYQQSSLLHTGSPLSPNASVSAVLFGVHLGTGVDLLLNQNIFFGASLIMHNLFGTTQTLENGSPFNIGGAYISFLVHSGISF